MLGRSDQVRAISSAMFVLLMSIFWGADKRTAWELIFSRGCVYVLPTSARSEVHAGKHAPRFRFPH